MRRHLAGFAFLLLLPLSVPSLAQAPVPPGATQTIPTQPPVTVNVAPQVVVETPADDGSPADWWTVWLTGGSAALTLGLFVLGGIQFRKQSQQTAQALEHSQNAAQAAVLALDLEERRHRPWVSVGRLSLAKTNRRGGRLVTLWLQNSGQSPARIMGANITVRAWQYVETEHGLVDVEPNELTRPPVYDEGHFGPPVILVVGEKVAWRHVVPEGADDGVFTVAPGDEAQLWIYGYINYMGLDSIDIRTYRFARQYDAVLSKRAGKFMFVPVSDAAYSFAD